MRKFYRFLGAYEKIIFKEGPEASLDAGAADGLKNPHTSFNRDPEEFAGQKVVFDVPVVSANSGGERCSAPSALARERSASGSADQVSS